MPELPEVEVTRRGLLPHLSERAVVEVWCSGKPLRQPVPDRLLRQCICGNVITTVDRRAKYLLIRLGDGCVLLVHFGMTGKLGIFHKTTKKAKHDHLCLRLDNDMELRFNDVRRFGCIAVWPADQATALEEKFQGRQGIEPFSPDFNGGNLARLAKRSGQPVKSFLMDAGRISGIGNIYANEILFASGIHPRTEANSLSEPQWQRVAECTVLILKKAIKAGGSTISDFLGSSGKPGYFQLQLAVYGKKDAACPNCGLSIEKESISGRATFFCPHCQPLL
jgi:formamidopyrimidine-DNA glycosylase